MLKVNILSPLTWFHFRDWSLQRLTQCWTDPSRLPRPLTRLLLTPTPLESGCCKPRRKLSLKSKKTMNRLMTLDKMFNFHTESLKFQWNILNIQRTFDYKLNIIDSNMTWLFSPIKSMDMNPGTLDDDRMSHRKAWLTAVAVVIVVPRIAILRIGVPRIGSIVCFLVPWVIIRVEIKMKSVGLILSSNLPRVIDWLNLSPRRFAARW